MDNTCPYDDLLLPRDVFIQILMCQPVISLLRFKSVCKSWRDLIESSFFVHLHAATTNTLRSSSKFGTFIFHTIQLQSKTEDEFTLYKTEDEFLMLSSRPGSGGGDDDDNDNEELFEVKSLGIPFPPHYKVSQKNYNDNILMVGSCKGLICLHNQSLKDVSLWNPTTKQFRILSKSLTLEEGIGDLLRDFVAFGFDIKTKDYKVVKITTFSPYKCGDYGWEYIFRVQVYNLSTNSWRLLEGINYLPAKPQQGWPRNHGLYLNGCYIFEGMSRSRHHLILSFDFTKETFTTMEFPGQDAIRYGSLCYLGGKIALFAKVASRGDHGYAYYDIWVLNEHGVKESWTKLHSIRSNPELPPIGMSNNGEFALLETKGDGHTWNSWTYKLELFNLVTKEAKGDFTSGAKVIKGDVYQESLVPIVGGGKGAQQSIGRLVVQCDFTP